MRLIDSHGHLNADRFDADVDLVVGAARLAGLERLLVPGWDLASSRRALDLVDRFPWLDAAAGAHPHDAARVDDAAWSDIASLAADARVVAVGETGLDFDRQFSPIPDQLLNLRRNLALAFELGKPAIIHVRSASGRHDAHDALLIELKTAGIGKGEVAATFNGRPPAIIHSFSGSVEFARAVLDLGLAISISGLAFRAGEEATAEAVTLVPADRLLVETDSPFLSPPGAPKRRNAPEWVRVTAAWVASQRGLTGEAVGDALVSAYDQTFPTSRSSRLRPPGSPG
jgi:TatD DNase family protein